MSIKSGIRDNHKRGKLGEYLSNCISPNSQLSFVSAYFTIYAYHALKDKLDGIHSLRFLFGEPSFLKSIDAQKSQSRSYEIQDNALTIPLKNRLQQSRLARECSAWIKDKVQIKSMVKPNFLHGKLYHFKAENETENAIMGSSNFTMGGLGLCKKSNMELNLEVSDKRDVQDLLTWFNELWGGKDDLVRDVKDEVLRYLDQLYANNAPEFVYYKTLYHIFKKYLDDQEEIDLSNLRVGFYDSNIWNSLYQFQKDGVKGAINKLEKHGGCIIADSVGLGKTYEALAIIHYYESLNYRVLLLCPKKLKENWTLYQNIQNNEHNPFKAERFSYAVLYHTDLGRVKGSSDANSISLENFNWGAYDLIVIDESHNLRGNPRQKVRKGEQILNRTKFLLEKVIKSGARSKVLMLSATPVNTSLKDLRNQIHYITEGDDAALAQSIGVQDISQTLKVAQTQFAKWAETSKGKKRNVNELYQVLDSGFFKLLDELTIARSRKHILKFYKDDVIGGFPSRLKPISVTADIDVKGRFYSYDKLSEEIDKYNLNLYSPSNYILEQYQGIYDERDSEYPKFRQAYRERYLIGMMKISFLKRLESSVHALRLTLKRTVDKIDALLEKIENFNEQSTSLLAEYDADIDEDDYEILDSEEQESWDLANTVGKKLKYRLEHLNLEQWVQDLIQDKEQLSALLTAAEQVSAEDDAKLQKLKERIEDKLQNPINEGNKKILIFTAFADTASYLYEKLSPWLMQKHHLHSGLVTGSGTNKSTLKMPKGKQNDFNEILTCFAPQAKKRAAKAIMPQQDIDLLIGTDCISEGQNLQDCDYVINYDIHWNPVRIIQRFGRIDRINSPNKQIQLINFWPTEHLDKYINLKHRVETRMLMVDLTATQDDDVISEEQFKDIESEELQLRTRQLNKLKEEVLDLEDMEESIHLTDFNLDDFRIDLGNYLKENQRDLEHTPSGIYAVTASPHHELWQANPRFELKDHQLQILRPGVIFCLKYLFRDESMDKLSPLHPYYLVYLHDSGEIRFHNSNSKQILELFRLLCLDKKKAEDALYEIFEDNTKQGQEMGMYNRLLDYALKDIQNSIQTKSKQAIQSQRDALIPIKQDEQENHFELITWLVIL